MRNLLIACHVECIQYNLIHPIINKLLKIIKLNTFIKIIQFKYAITNYLSIFKYKNLVRPISMVIFNITYRIPLAIFYGRIHLNILLKNEKYQLPKINTILYIFLLKNKNRHMVSYLTKLYVHLYNTRLIFV